MASNARRLKQLQATRAKWLGKTSSQQDSKNLSEKQRWLCLCLIVKNEAHILKQTLTHLMEQVPQIDSCCIVDTGSTDDTLTIIRDFFKEYQHRLVGHLVERPWVNFGHNRSEALDECFGLGEFILMFDADDLIKNTLPPQPWEGYAHSNAVDGFSVRFRDENSGIEYWRQSIFRNNRTWCYRGALHEYPCLKDTTVTARVARLAEDSNYSFDSRRLGARNLNPNKYRDDAALLLREVQKDPTNTRNTYYLAQSYFDAGMREEAAVWYRKRIQLDSSSFADPKLRKDKKNKKKKRRPGKETAEKPHHPADEEVYFSAMRLGELAADVAKKGDGKEHVSENLESAQIEKAVSLWQEAKSYAPERYEPLESIIRLLIHRKEWQRALVFARQVPLALSIPQHSNLYICHKVYDYQLHCGAAMAAAHCQEWALAKDFLHHVLKTSKLMSAEERALVEHDERVCELQMTNPTAEQTNGCSGWGGGGGTTLLEQMMENSVSNFEPPLAGCWLADEETSSFLPLPLPCPPESSAQKTDEEDAESVLRLIDSFGRNGGHLAPQQRSGSSAPFAFDDISDCGFNFDSFFSERAEQSHFYASQNKNPSSLSVFDCDWTDEDEDENEVDQELSERKTDTRSVQRPANEALLITVLLLALIAFSLPGALL